MRFVSVFFMLLLMSPLAWSRKPAVEDFVGVEPESYRSTPPGTEVLFNFDKKVKQMNRESQPPWYGLGVVILFLTLPFMVWSLLSRQMNAPTSNKTSTQNASENGTVHQIDDYRKSEEDSKKAS